MGNKSHRFQQLLAATGLGCFPIPEPIDPVVPPAIPATPPSKAPPPKEAPSPRSRTYPFRRDTPTQPLSNWLPQDSYKDVKELAHGSEAKTSLTKSRTTGELYVVKRFSRYQCYDAARATIAHQNGVQPLPNEAAILLTVLRPHPNILRVFGCDLIGVRKSNVYSEYCSGGDLIDQINFFHDINRVTPERMALHTMISLSHALACLHTGLRRDPEAKRYWQEPSHTPIVHGDIKAENVFLKWTGKNDDLPTIVLGDLGQSQPANHFKGISGTVGYQAPEVAAMCGLKDTNRRAFQAAVQSFGIMTPASDIYSMAQTVHIACTGRLHITGANPFAQPVRRTSFGVLGVELGGRWGYDTAGLTTLVQRCLSPDPADRPKATLGDLLEDVAGLMVALEEKRRANEPIQRCMWKLPPP